MVQAVESSRSCGRGCRVLNISPQEKIAWLEVRRSGWPAKQCLVHCNEFGQKWIMGLTSVVSRIADTQSTYQGWKKKIGEFLFSSVGPYLPSFPPFKYTDFMKCVRKLWITLYNLDFILQKVDINLIWRFHEYPNYIFSCQILIIIFKFLLTVITEYHLNVKECHDSQHGGLHVWAT